MARSRLRRRCRLRIATGQRFGVAYLVDILLGKSDDRIARNGHDRLSVFGIGDDFDAKGWRSLFRQLIAAGMLAPDAEGHGTLLLTEKARPVLRGENKFEVRRPPKKAASEANAKAKRSGRARVTVSADDTGLFEALRVLRRDLAANAGVPPYVICHDRTLAELATIKPKKSGGSGRHHRSGCCQDRALRRGPA